METPKLFKWFRRSADRSDLLNPKQWLLDAISGNKTVINISVTEDSAMRQSAVYACVRILAETIASLPLNVYERKADGKFKTIEHPLYEILHNKPNEYMTSFSWRETIMSTILLRGNTVNNITRNGKGDVIRVFPYPYSRVTIEIKDGGVVYTYKNENNQNEVLDNDSVFHIPGLSFNGIIGLSPITYAKEAIAYGIALEQFGEYFFENRTNIGGIAKHPGKLSEQGSDNLRKSLNDTYAGLGNSHKLMLLEEGMEFMPVTIAPADAQYLELRKFQLEEIARIFRVPPHLLQDLTRSTNNNIEHQSIDFVVHSVRPWLVRIEQAINSRLFKDSEKGKYFAEFVVDGLLRGDTASRWEAYAKAIQNGVYSPNDVLEFENKNPYKGGDKHFIQLNMQPVENVGKTDANIRNTQDSLEVRTEKAVVSSKQLRSAKTKAKLATAYKGLFEQLSIRILKREIKDITDILKKSFKTRDSQIFNEKIDLYYQEFRDFVREQAKPALAAYSDAVAVEAADEVGINPEFEFNRFLEKYNEGYAANYTNKNALQLKNTASKAINENKDPVQAVEGELENWERDMPDDVATEETVKLAGAISLLVYKIAGVTKYKVVNTGGNTCPFCQQLNGKVVGIDKFVVVDGQQLGEGENIMVVSGNKAHAPFHKKCVCQVVAEG